MRRVRFGDIVEQKTDTLDPVASKVERYVAIEHLDPMTPSVERWGEVEEGTTFNRRFEAGDVLFSKRRAYQRKAARVSFGGVCSGDLLVFSAKEGELRPGLLPFIVQSESFFNHALATSAGSLSPRTRWKDLADFEFALPDSDAQAHLEEKLQQSEAVRLAWMRVAAKLGTIRKVRARSLTSEGIWPKVPLREVATVRNGATPSRRNMEYWDGGDVPWLPTGKVHDREIHEADEFITVRALDECPLRLVPADSVLVAMIGQGKTRGRAAYLHIEAAINQNFAAVIPGDEVDGRFLFHTLAASYNTLRHISQGSSQGALNCRLIGEFVVPLPPPKEQRRLAARFDAIGDAENEAVGQSKRTLALQRTLTDLRLMASHVH